ncbi:lipopolysaccharide biosynthesis protein [Nocardia sp. NBC_00416]|uniref:lipopolysaccharide biosynthesis protein n=1 Tax=Nocardia sp. NBC_00416 TaxID=2975991 RepID=UPI002E1E450B
MNLSSQHTIPIRIVHRHYPVSLDGLRVPDYDLPTEIIPAFADWPTEKLPLITTVPEQAADEPRSRAARLRELATVLRDIAYVSFGKYGQYLVTVATLPLIARLLGASGMGLLAIGMSSYFLGSLIVDLGITSYLAARVQDSGTDRDVVNHTRGTYLAIRGGILGVLGTALVAAVPAGAPEYLTMVLLGLFVGGFWSMSEDWVLIGQGRFGASTLYQSIARVGYLAALLTLLPRFPTAAMAMLCLLGSSVISLALTWWDTWRTFGPPGRPRGAWKLLRAALPVVTGRLLVTSYGQGAAAVYGAVLNAVSLGLYSASDRLVRAVQSLLDPIGFALLPRMAKRGGDERFWPDALRGLAACVAIACVATVALWTAAPLIIPLVFGAEFGGAVGVLRLEAVILPATTVTSFVTTAVLPVRQDTVGVLIGSAAGTAVAVCALLLTMRTHSLWTLAGGIVAAEFAVAIWYLARMRALIVRERAGLIERGRAPGAMLPADAGERGTP